MVKRMGWAEPIGKRLSIRGENGRVVGVVQDFNFQSLHKSIEPFVLYAISNDFSRMPLAVRPIVQNVMLVNVAGDDLQETLGVHRGGRDEGRSPASLHLLVPRSSSSTISTSRNSG